MPTTTQVVISEVSKPGVLARVTSVLASAGVNIKAFSAPEVTAKSQQAIVQPLVLTCLLFALWGIDGCAGRPVLRGDYPPGYPIGYVERGVASWYGPGFHGNQTANGERFDMHQFTAAHRTLPLGSVATVRSLSNGRRITVRINDRGPFARN